MSRLVFQNNHSPPTKQFQQAQPRRRPRAPHGHATKCSFLEAANSCIPTCASAQNEFWVGRVAQVEHMNQPGRAAEHLVVFPCKDFRMPSPRGTLRLSAFDKAIFNSDVC